jgi:beta-glucosidase
MFHTPIVTGAAALAGLLASVPAWAGAWGDPDLRALFFAAQMTQDEKIALVDGQYAVPVKGVYTIPAGALGSAGFVAGPARLGLPNLQESDAGIGVADPTAIGFGVPVRGVAGYSTELPSGLAMAATFNPGLAFAGGAMIGREAHREGFNVILAGAMDLTREPRCGRNFEYAGEDPLLAGVMAGQQIAGVQAQHVMSTVKHYALNAQETGRMVLSADIGEASLRQSDLLAFETAIETGQPAAVMCAYNRLNGVYACENPFLLNQVLKQDWGFAGWVMSDWGAVHAVTDINAGLDQESGDIIDLFEHGARFFAGLGAAIADGTVPQWRLDNAVLRILRSEFATGAYDYPAVVTPINPVADAAVAQAAEEQAAVLLKNTGGLLPLSKSIRRIAVIGGNAAQGVITGGGSSQVLPVGGPALPIDTATVAPHPVVWNPSAPVAALAAEVPGAAISYSDGSNVQAAAAAAASADVAIVFVDQPMSEGYDAPSLSLPPEEVTGANQDALVAAVAAANPRTVVVVESGGPVLMPWLAQAGAVLQAWFPGAAGGKAIARVLFGDVDAAGRLPISFPANTAQLPRPVLDGTANPNQPFDVNYAIEGAAVGYKWFQRQGLTPLFPFGYGQSYTQFSYGKLRAYGGQTVHVSFTVTNIGKRAGYAVPQAYLNLPAGAAEDTIRLVGWKKMLLQPGKSAHVTLTADPRLAANFDAGAQLWRTIAGPATVKVGASSADLPLSADITLTAGTLLP